MFGGLSWFLMLGEGKCLVECYRVFYVWFRVSYVR